MNTTAAAARVIQYGTPRSGSTFQFALACLALRLAHRPRPVRCTYADKVSRPPDELEVLKTHEPPPAALLPGVALLTSGSLGDARWDRQLLSKAAAGHSQGYATFSRCPLDEVPTVSGLLGVRDAADVAALVDFMRLWSVLRRCCGPGMAVEAKLALLGCPPDRRVSDGSARCGRYNLAAVESALSASPLWQLMAQKTLNATGGEEEDGWARGPPGTCAAENERVRRAWPAARHVPGSPGHRAGCSDVGARAAASKGNKKWLLRDVVEMRRPGLRSTACAHDACPAARACAGLLTARNESGARTRWPRRTVWDRDAAPSLAWHGENMVGVV